MFPQLLIYILLIVSVSTGRTSKLTYEFQYNIEKWLNPQYLCVTVFSLSPQCPVNVLVIEVNRYRQAKILLPCSGPFHFQATPTGRKAGSWCNKNNNLDTCDSFYKMNIIVSDDKDLRCSNFDRSVVCTIPSRNSCKSLPTTPATLGDQSTAVAGDNSKPNSDRVTTIADKSVHGYLGFLSVPALVLIFIVLYIWKPHIFPCHGKQTPARYASVIELSALQRIPGPNGEVYINEA